MDFDTYLQQAGFKPGQFIPPDVVKVHMQKHAELVQQQAQGQQMPTLTTLANGQEVVTFGNTMQIPRQSKADLEIMQGKDGLSYVVNPSTGAATVITNQTGEPFAVQQKADMAGAMMALLAEQSAGAAPVAQDAGWWNNLTGGAQPTARPTPEASPVPSPAVVPQAAPMPLQEGMKVRQNGKVYVYRNGKFEAGE